MTASVIRPARDDDHAALVELFAALNRFEEELAGNRRIDLAGAEDSLAAAWRAVIDSGGAALVAERESRVVGHLFLVFQDDGAYVRPALRRVAYVAELFVREEARRRGIAAALMAEAERIARAAGVARLMVGVLAGNDGAARLYRREGFSPHAIEFEKKLR